MSQSESAADQATAWERVSQLYQERQAIPWDQVRYGPFGPDEGQLGLLGKVAGLRVLDLGCGGGQAAVALARQGAEVTGVDFSRRQLAFARRLAARAEVSVDFVWGDLAAADLLPDQVYDRILSVYALQYVDDLAGCLAQCRRLLRHGGRLVISLEHPFRDCFWDQEEEEETLYPARSYFDQQPMRWRFADSDQFMRSYHRTLGDWIDALHGAGLRLERLVEPEPAALSGDELWVSETDLEVGSKLPHTAIFVATTAVG